MTGPALVALAAWAAAAPPSPPAAEATGPDTVAATVAPSAFEKEALTTARKLLASTEAGRPVLEFLDRHGVKVLVAELSESQHGGFGREVEKGTPSIVVSRSGRGELSDRRRAAVQYAATLAHEVTHALFRLELDLPPFVEEEAACFFKELEIQHELAFLSWPLGTFEMELRYRLLRHEGGVDRLVESVRDAYATRMFEQTREAAGEGPGWERRRAKVERDWRRQGAADRYTPIRELVRKARDPERKAELSRAEAHWNSVLEAFRAKVASWPELPEKPATVNEAEALP